MTTAELYNDARRDIENADSDAEVVEILYDFYELAHSHLPCSGSEPSIEELDDFYNECGEMYAEEA